MLLSQILQMLLGGGIAAGGLSLKRGIKDAGWSLAALLFGAWCVMMALLVLAAALWLALAPELGAAAATAIVGLLFLLAAGVVYLVHWRRKEMKRIGKKLDQAADAPSELQQQIMQSITANIGPILLTAVATFLVSRLTRRD
ncbi:MAG TPA: hypothetical protein VG742_05560 [Dongiaceae bacterium]|nr:hypothetical protein [Dongiaceae bacterium]